MRGLLFILFVAVLSVASAQSTGEDCNAVRGMYITNVTQSSAKLVWEKNSMAEGYLYAISKSVIPPEKFGKFLKEPGVTEEGLASGATYYAHVRTKCAGTGISQWTTVQFNTPAPYNQAIVLDNTFAFSVHPLQTDMSVTIKIKGSNEYVATVWIQDMYGVEVGSYPLIGDRLHVDVNSLHNGVYYIFYNDFYGRIQRTRFTKTSSRILNDH